jgi:hypothetical protein
VREGRIELDGRVDEAAWLAALVLPMTQHWPDYGADRSERTRFLLLHDAEHLWLSGVFRADPDDVRGVSLYRDVWNGDDAVDLLVDVRNDDVTGLLFTTTPLGVRIDGEIRNDAAPGGGVQPYNAEWNGLWDVRSVILDDGWSFELRIPYETLGVRGSGDAPATVGIIVSREQAVGQWRDMFPAIRPDWSMSHAKPSLAHDIELPAARGGLPLFTTPYVLSGAERTRRRDAVVPAAPVVEVPLEVGGDVRVGVGPSLTLDLTANTDFAQVESDALQVNLDRFNLFFPEKRQFFQERAANFDFQMGPEIRLFHSRTVGLDADGRPQRIWGGGRLTGNVAGWDVGALSLQVDGGAGAGENDAALRLQRPVGAGRSRAGGIFTSRLVGGEARLTVGADGRVHLGGDDWLTLQLAGTSSPTDGAAMVDRSAARLFWERRSLDGFAWEIEGVRSGTDFSPALGFAARDAFTSGIADLYYSRRPGPGSVLARWRFIATTRGYWRSADASVESALHRLRTQLFFRNGFFWNTALNLTYEHLDAPLALPGATVPAGGYRGVDLFTNVDLPRSMRLGGFAVVHVGSVFDGLRTDVTVGGRLNFSRHVTVQPEVQLQRLSFGVRDQVVRADRAGLRVQAALDTRFSAEAFVQYNRAADRVAANARLRYQRGEGRDVFLVYEGVRDLGDLLDPTARALGRTDGRLLLKVTHTLRW